MQNKALDVSLAKQEIGWAYSSLKWLGGEEAQVANHQRNELLAALGASPLISRSFMQTKVHIGELSPGCVLCGQGFWSCMFINGLCTANCFYCPQDRAMVGERIPNASGIAFNLPEEYADYLYKLNFKGVGFSGGEPFLALDKLLIYLKTIRRRFGKKIYLWVYTNGDLVKKNKLRQLKESGLDEIRFNISARNYDLERVKEAVGIIDTVTVEIPAIPEDLEIVKKNLSRMKRMGVKYLNLHQLYATACNFEKLKDRGYTFLHQASVPMLESELTALKIMKFSDDHKIGLSINYCSSAYKARFQEKGQQERVASYGTDDFEEMTAAGYRRTLSIQGPQTVVKRIVDALSKNCPQKSWACKNAATGIFLHGSMLRYIDMKGAHMTATYLRSWVERNEEGGNKLVSVREPFRFSVKKEKVYESKLFGEASKEAFFRLFVERANEKEAMAFFYKNHILQTQADIQVMEAQKRALQDLKKFEIVEAGFPDIY